ncbi:OmpP1/FadL family transporter [Thauera phenolivorans]|uniref:OmpP1/FadL family transporter n=1 Tax=Thauera phenolivorans TaxID=1792543 RepID=UPI00083A4723|nr:outer membrane protein transport protein [Thauera phenolivorans]
MLRTKLAAGLAVTALSASVQVAHATDVFHLEGIGAISRAMGGTAAAQDVGPAGMLTNPATLSLAQSDRQAMIGFDLVTTDIDVRNPRSGDTASSRTHGNNRGPYLAPQLALTQRFGDLVIGLGAFARGGLGTEYGRDSFLSRATDGSDTDLDNASRLLVLDIPLAASYRVSDALTVGASVDAIWQGLNLDMLLGADQVGSLIGQGRATGSLVPALGGIPGLQGAHFSLTRNRMLASGVDAWGISGRLGMLYQLTPATRLGASYTLKSHMDDMEGDATLTAVSSVAGQISLPGKIEVRDFRMPAKLDLGISQRLTDDWSVAMDVSRVFWKEVMKDIDVAFDASGGGSLEVLLPQNYRDQTIVALGTAYTLSPQWTLRAGARFASQALRENTLFAVIPATPTRHLSFGFSYTMSPGKRLEFAYSHALREKLANASLPNTSAPIEVRHAQNNATLDYTLSF